MWLRFVRRPALVLRHLKSERKLHVTCYPGFGKYLPDAEVLQDGVVVDRRMITGKGRVCRGVCIDLVAGDAFRGGFWTGGCRDVIGVSCLSFEFNPTG